MTKHCTEPSHPDQPGRRAGPAPHTASHSSRRTFRKAESPVPQLPSHFPRTQGGALSVGEGQPPLHLPPEPPAELGKGQTQLTYDWKLRDLEQHKCVLLKLKTQEAKIEAPAGLAPSQDFEAFFLASGGVLASPAHRSIIHTSVSVSLGLFPVTLLFYQNISP